MAGRFHSIIYAQQLKDSSRVAVLDRTIELGSQCVSVAQPALGAVYVKTAGKTEMWGKVKVNTAV